MVKRIKDQQDFSMRVVPSNGKKEENFIESAIENYKTMQHKHIVRYVDAFISSKGTNDKKIYIIVTELCNDDLKSLLHK